jgi:predicted Fe-S protein YdhL (DUF1289 family)
MSPNERLAKRARLVCDTVTSDVPSPCISLCRMSSVTQLCLGCFRTLDEIALWGRMDDGSKLEVWRSVQERVAQSPITREEDI